MKIILKQKNIATSSEQSNVYITRQIKKFVWYKRIGNEIRFLEVATWLEEFKVIQMFEIANPTYAKYRKIYDWVPIKFF